MLVNFSPQLYNYYKTLIVWLMVNWSCLASGAEWRVLGDGRRRGCCGVDHMGKAARKADRAAPIYHQFYHIQMATARVRGPDKMAAKNVKDIQKRVLNIYIFSCRNCYPLTRQSGSSGYR